MLRYTHFYDMLYKFLALLAGASVAGLIIELISPLLSQANRDIKWMVGSVILICSILGVMYLLCSKMGWIPTLLYIRFTLHTKVSPSEGKTLSFLLDGSLGGKWYPCRWILEVNPESRRREALFEFASITSNELAKDTKAKIKCPDCGNCDAYKLKTTTGYWCPHCKKQVELKRDDK